MDRCFLLIFIIASTCTRAEITQDKCQLPESQRDTITARGAPGRDIGLVHQVELGNNSLCFSGVTQTHTPSCCTREMENVFRQEATDIIRSDIGRNLNKAQSILSNHTAEFELFVADSVEFVRQWTVVRLNDSYYINEGMLDEINHLFEDILEYIRGETDVSRSEIARNFLRELYSELVGQKTRRKTKKYVNCSLKVMAQIDPYFVKLHQDYIESILAQPLLDAKAYLLGLKEARGVFSSLEGMPVYEGCTTNILRMTSCSYCKGHGLEAPICAPFCPRLYKGCTRFHRGGFFKNWQGFVNIMRLIGENMIQIPFSLRKLSIAIGKAVEDFDFLWRKTHYYVQSVCGRHRRPDRFGHLGDVIGTPYVDRDYYGYAVSIADDDIVGNLTELFTNPETFCESSSTDMTDAGASDPAVPCWNGTDMSLGEADPGEVLLTGGTPLEVLRSAKLLKRLNLKLRQATLQGVDSLLPYDGENRDDEWSGGKKDENKPIYDVDDGIDSAVDYEAELCPNHWARYNSSCYFLTSRLPFLQARVDCEAQGGTLASILSYEENEFIAELLVNRRAWIGATRGYGGEFLWLDGATPSFNETSLLENDDTHACAVIVINRWGRGLWKSASCENRNVAVCKRSL